MPAVLLFVMFILIMTTTPQLLNSVIEEKMSKISEVLLGSVAPFELMLGKLLGNASIAIVLAVCYVGGGYAVAAYYGYADAIAPVSCPRCCSTSSWPSCSTARCTWRWARRATS